jgi:hypothetical protein
LRGGNLGNNTTPKKADNSLYEGEEGLIHSETCTAEYTMFGLLLFLSI